ncbi:MAG: carboxylesterase family protein [Bacteroidales bacterium]|nr:carboxylesterase family protein [Bacteroidales bacterium]
MGLLDITAGLRWVHENIHEFGSELEMWRSIGKL